MPTDFTATLIVFGGLPGVGKSTLARELAARIGAFHLRIDTIEQRIRDSGMESAARAAIREGLAEYEEIGAAGYLAAYGVAADNLSAGRVVLADSVNPIGITRNAWRSVARRARARLVEVELVCTDTNEHRHRVESRSTDIPGLTLPNWEKVQGREYEDWPEAHQLDTAHRTVEDCLQELLELARM